MPYIYIFFVTELIIPYYQKLSYRFISSILSKNYEKINTDLYLTTVSFSVCDAFVANILCDGGERGIKNFKRGGEREGCDGEKREERRSENEEGVGVIF